MLEDSDISWVAVPSPPADLAEVPIVFLALVVVEAKAVLDPAIKSAATAAAEISFFIMVPFDYVACAEPLFYP